MFAAVVVWVCVGTAVLVAGTRVSFPSEATRALVKVELFFLDEAGGVLSDPPPDSGLGVLVSPDGVILTAAHVLLPMRDRIGSAKAYRIDVKLYNRDTGTWQPIGRHIHSKNLLDHLLASNALPIEMHPHLPSLPVLAERPDPDVDVVFLTLPDAANMPYFLEVAGADYDPAPFPSASKYSATVLDGSARSADLDNVVSVAGRLETNFPSAVEPGHSGSAILLVEKDQPPFVVGVVARNIPDPAKPNATTRRAAIASVGHLVGELHMRKRRVPPFIAPAASCSDGSRPVYGSFQNFLQGRSLLDAVKDEARTCAHEQMTPLIQCLRAYACSESHGHLYFSGVRLEAPLGRSRPGP